MARKNQRNNKKQSVTPARKSRKASRPNRAPNRVTECGRKYARCVLDPLSGSPSKIPDGAAASVLIEYDLAISGTPTAGGGLVFAAVPGLPCSAWGLDGTFTGPDRTGTPATVAVTNSTNKALFPFQDFNSGIIGAVVGTSVYYNAPLEVQAARMVSFKLEVTPTGALLQQGGSSVTARVPMQFKYHPFIGDTGTTVANRGYVGAAAHPYWGVYELPPTSFNQLSAYPDSKLCPGTESCVLMGLQQDDDFSSVIPTWQVRTSGATPVFVIAGDTAPYQDESIITLDAPNLIVAAGTGQPTVAMIPSVGGTDICTFGNFWQPDDTQALVWAGQGLPTGQAYTFRVRACMELMVSHAASTYRPFVTPAEPDDPVARKHVRDIVRAMPSSMPKEGSSPGWWATLGSSVSGLAGAVAELGLPVVSPIAGVTRRLMNALGV